MNIVFDSENLASTISVANTTKRNRLTQYTKAGFISIFIHFVVLLAIGFSALRTSSNVEPPKTKPISSYLYVAPQKLTTPMMTPKLIQDAPKTSAQIATELRNKEGGQTEKVLSTEKYQSVPSTHGEVLDTKNVAQTKNHSASQVDSSQLLLNQDNAQKSISVPQGIKDISILDASSNILQEMQTSHIDAVAQQEATAFRKEQVSPKMMPVEKRVDTWAKRQTLKKNIVYCDSGLKSTLAALSQLTQSEEMAGAKVQCKPLPDLQPFINNRLQKGFVENEQDSAQQQ